ncbi:hypothetical protein [Maridesulfovibrio salexigens]|uniref:hypothetical protein n=1 Tax=Maridesulfovibrio salexigens TaxID=880 RepID=UPI0012ED7153|nr:hypothetical protein [Maridesulfovibrio salexigens]
MESNIKRVFGPEWLFLRDFLGKMMVGQCLLSNYVERGFLLSGDFKNIAIVL